VSHIPVLIPTVLLLTALLALLIGLRSARAGHAVSLLGMVTAFLLSVGGLRALLAGGGEPLRYAMGNWLPPIGIEFVLDHLAAYMTVLISFLGVLVLIFAPRAMARETPGREGFAWPAMVLLVAGLNGMCLTGDVFNLYVFLEIAALSAYALLAIGDRAAPVASLRYLLVGAVAGGFYLIGVAFLYFSTGTLNMADLYARLPELVENRAILTGAVFIVLGLAIKMALFPFHFWLPDVYTQAPSAVVGIVAPVMTKVSAYAIIRIFLDVFPPGFFTEVLPMATTLGWMSAGGILFGSILAVSQQDYRRMLAYSSVGQVAYVGIGIGMANPIGMIGGLLHILNHALMKACLFLVGGAIRYRTGRTRIPDFAGLGKTMPWTMAAFVVGALAMVGIPPTAGFFSKWYLLLGALEAGNLWWFGVIMISSLLTAIYFFRVVETIYRDPAPDAPQLQDGVGEGEAPASMLVPILILGGGILVAGLMNVVIVNALLERVVAPLAG
jgi:multicomponent Na+:H+ antiporter subunit D